MSGSKKSALDEYTALAVTVVEACLPLLQTPLVRQGEIRVGNSMWVGPEFSGPGSRTVLLTLTVPTEDGSAATVEAECELIRNYTEVYHANLHLYTVRNNWQRFLCSIRSGKVTPWGADR